MTNHYILGKQDENVLVIQSGKYTKKFLVNRVRQILAENVVFAYEIGGFSALLELCSDHILFEAHGKKIAKLDKQEFKEFIDRTWT